MVECRKCQRSEMLYIPEREKDGTAVTHSYVSSGLVRCDRKGHKYVSKDVKPTCSDFKPRRA